MIDRRHVHQEAPRQSDVASDARAFLAERLLGDLYDHVLTGFQHFRNQLWASRRTGVSAVMAVRATRTAAFETTGRPSPAAIRSATAIVASAIASAAAIRPLESRAGIAAANARGIAWETFARFWTPGARRTSLAGQKNGVVFDRSGSCRSCRRPLGRFVLGHFAGGMLSKFGGVQRAFMRRISFRLSQRVRIGGFLLLRLFVRALRGFTGVNFLVLFGRGFFVLGRFLVFLFFLFKDGTADHGIGVRLRLRLFVLGFHQAGGNHRHFFFTQRSIRANRLRFRRFLRPGGGFRDDRTGVFGRSGDFFRPGRGGFRLVSRFREQPARQAAGRAPWQIASRRGSSRLHGRRTWQRFSRLCLRFPRFRFDHWSGRFVAIFGQRFAGQYERLFILIGWSRRRSIARTFGPAAVALLVTAILRAALLVAARIVRALLALW